MSKHKVKLPIRKRKSSGKKTVKISPKLNTSLQSSDMDTEDLANYLAGLGPAPQTPSPTYSQKYVYRDDTPVPLRIPSPMSQARLDDLTTPYVPFLDVSRKPEPLPTVVKRSPSASPQNRRRAKPKPTIFSRAKRKLFTSPK